MRHIKEWIVEQLQAHLHPTFMEVIDESALHADHQGMKAGQTETHFRIRIQSLLLEGLTRVEQHKRIYEILQIERCAIHALAIEVIRCET